MNLANKIVYLFLAEEGLQVLGMASIACDPEHPLRAEVVESDDLGLWIRKAHGRDEHNFLLRWDYILGVDVPAGTAKPFGLTGRKD